MTTTEIGRAQTPEFPIVWDDPEHEQASWFQDVMHNPLPITPLTATMFQPAFAEGAGRSMARLMLPITGLALSIQNGYVYLSPIPISFDVAVIEARLLETQRVTMELAPTVLRDWRESFEPQVQERARRILDFDYDGSSAQQVARFVVERRSDLVDVWDIHMRVNLPPMNAVFALEEVIGGALGAEGVTLSRQLLQGFDNKSVETGRALWDLSRWVRSDDALKSVVLASRVRNGALEIQPHPKSGEFETRLRTFLDEYGWRSDLFFEIGHKSWHEDPSTPLTQLKGYIAKDDAQDPFAAHAAHAERRDRLADELEARLPDELRPVFRSILPMAQQYVPIAEDHNFSIDQGFTAVMRHGVLQLGKKLVADELLADPEDVFYLTYDEIRAIAAGTPSAPMSREVPGRRREHGRQATLQAPQFIGTLPPEDAPPDPMLTKFFGVGLLPSEDANVITGHPCSLGVVTGIAKIVLTLDDADKLLPGDVLVCRMTMPAWTPLFGVAAAVVADSGGPLSHCAIVAREYGIPCIAGTVNGTSVLRDGMRVRVDGSTGVATVLSDKTRG